MIAGAAMLFLAAVGAVWCLISLKQTRERDEQLAKNIAEQNTEITRLKGEGEKIRQQLSPDQKALLSAAHKLVANKRFGWSRLFADLEGVMPPSVSASRISIENVFIDGDKVKAELDLSVLSRDYASVARMMESMQNSGLFLTELKGQDLQKGESITYTEYTLHVIYSPSAGLAGSSDVAMNTLSGNNAGGGQ